jgi:DNA-nicking Smr family endonuclease
MLNWAELTQDWGASYARAKRRFPNLRDKDVARIRKDREQFEAYLAERHHLTVNEAREELDDFLFTESLNREVSHF